MSGITKWQKCMLLLWKNGLIKWNAKRALIFELIVPVFYFLLLILFRLNNGTVTLPFMTYKEFHINNIDKFKALSKPIEFQLNYSPQNAFLENIVKLAAKNLELTATRSYSNALALEKSLSDGKILAGIQFDDSWSTLKAYPKQFSFALRFPSELRGMDGKTTWSTNKLYPPVDFSGSRNVEDSDGGYPLGYLSEGFLPIQHALTMSYLELVTGKNDLPKVVMERYPYSKSLLDHLLKHIEGILPMLLVLSLLYSATCIVKYITAEKEKQLKEVMKIMGLSNWMHWMAWFVLSLITMGIPIFLIVLMLKVDIGSNGAVLIHTDFLALLILMFVYMMNSICFCFMLATLFNKANTASIVTGLVWFMSLVPYINMYRNEFGLAPKLASCLIPNSAIGWSFLLIVQFEGKAEGLTMSNLFTPVNIDDDLTIGYIIIMMLISCVLCLCICLYVEQVFPGEFGVARKWYFIFTAKFWCCKKDNPDDNDVSNDHIERHNPNAFELEPVGQHIGVQVKNLKKKFGKKMAVNGLSVNMYEDEITVLLGHNGAGKTTTICMLVGMFRPTSGTAIINGYDIRTSMDGARMSMGICPQHNVLFDNLTVAQHLTFFTRLRGLKGRAMSKEINKYIKLIELEDQRNVASKKLSGGMKRKLSVCCALTGNTKIVLLDEPSSGLDPSARRQLWDLLQGEKTGRTILLTTHFMDEADVLGDRIAIMCHGELKCHGSSFFLKKKYGSGYRLICVKRHDCKSSNITAVLRKFIPDLRPESEIAAEITYLLPDRYSSQFENMLNSLENQSDDLNINGYGISISSLEEVFMKVGAENNEENTQILPKKTRATTVKDGSEDSDDVESITSDRLFSENTRLLKGVQLFSNQWQAMLLKKFLNTFHNKILLCFQFFFTITYISLHIGLDLSKDLFGHLKPMTIGLTQYPLAVTVLETAPDVAAGSLQHNISEKYQAIATSYGSNYEFVKTGKQNFSSFILDLGQTIQVRINDRYMAGATIANEKITAWLNNEPLHTAPLTVNLVHNAIVKALMNDSYEITVTNAPLPYNTTTQLTNLKEKSIGGGVANNISFCFCFVTASFILFVIKERETRYKLLQFVGGVKIWTFWLSQFLWDFMTYTLICVILVVIIACCKINGLSTPDQLARVILMLVLFGCAALTFTYLLSFLFNEPATGFVRIFIINIFFGMMMELVLASFPPEYEDKLNIVRYILRIYPHFSLYLGLGNLIDNAELTKFCVNFHDAYKCEMLPKCCPTKPFFAWAAPGVLYEVVYLAATAVICFLFVILLEYRMCAKFKQLCYKCQLRYLDPPQSDDFMDADVAEENKTIDNMSSTHLQVTNLVLERVTKYYGRFLAVNELSLCVKPNECFGLLGVNGAGKTTTFKMMTGDEYITSGSAYVRGMHLAKDMSKIRKEIGYCPQFDAILVDFTGRENLKIFCLIRGIQKERIKPISEELATAFGFHKYLDEQAKKYSGGNKRKLSAAIAVIGSPSVVYLDEPTTGMDPTARRQLWNMVSRIRESGKSIVLTSHSMEECEALCTRLAIMVNGEFKCIGSTQHLKNKFSKGLVLKIKLKRKPDLEPTKSFLLPRSRKKKAVKRNTDLRNTDSNLEATETAQSSKNLDEDVAKVKDFVAEQFPDAVLQEEYLGMLTYHIPLAVIKWSRIFGIMEKNREALNIEDYSISQTTLEEIFLEFAKHQSDDRDRSSKFCGCC